MSQHIERRLSGKPKLPSAPQGFQFRELTRFSGGYLNEVRQRIDEYTQSHPDADRDELVATISLKANEKPRVDDALDALNQLSVLGIKKGDEIGSRVRTFIVQQMTPPGRIVYEAVWFGEKPESLTKPKEEPKPQTAPKPQVQYPFRPAGQHEQQRQHLPSREFYRDSRRREREEREAIEKILKEKNDLRDVIVDRVREIGEYMLTHDSMDGSIRIELGDDGVGVILYSNLFTRNPDRTARFVAVNRETGEYEEGINGKYTSFLRADLVNYLKIKAQQLEGQEVEYKPKLIDPAKIERVYDRALTLGLLKKNSTSDGIEFWFEAFASGSIIDPGQYVKIDLGRNVAGATRYIEIERPLNPQFTRLLARKKAELESFQHY